MGGLGRKVGTLMDRGLHSATQIHSHAFPGLQGEKEIQLGIKSLSQHHKKCRTATTLALPQT